MKKTLKTDGLDCALIEEIARSPNEVMVYFGSPDHELYTDVFAKSEESDLTGQYFYTTDEQCGRDHGLDEMPAIALFNGGPEFMTAYPQDRPNNGDLKAWARSGKGTHLFADMFKGINDAMGGKSVD